MLVNVLGEADVSELKLLLKKEDYRRLRKMPGGEKAEEKINRA